MPVNKKQSNSSVIAPAARKCGAKAPGTRNGTLEDWREASEKENSPKERRNPLRDGR